MPLDYFISALVTHKVYPDPYFGMNLRSIPGPSSLVCRLTHRDGACKPNPQAPILGGPQFALSGLDRLSIGRGRLVQVVFRGAR